MGKRVHANNPLWVLTCCGCLPFIGLLKGIIIVVPVMLVYVLPMTLTAIVWMPHVFWYSYYGILLTQKLGWKVKFLCSLLMPVPMVLWPPVILICSLFVGFGHGLFVPIVKTFDSDYNIFYGGMGDVFKESIDHVKQFWNFHRQAYFSFMDEFRTKQLAPGEKPFDIKIIELFVGLFLCACAWMTVGIVMPLEGLLFLIPAMLRAYYELNKTFFKTDGCLFCIMMTPVYIIANLLVPVGAVLAWVFVVLLAIVSGPWAAGRGYSKGVTAAFGLMRDWIEGFHKGAVKWVTEGKN